MKLIIRTLSGAILIAIMLLCLTPGGIPGLVFSFVLSVAALYEFYRLHDKEKSPFFYAAIVWSVIWYASIAALPKEEILIPFILLFFLAAMIFVFTWPKAETADVVFFLGSAIYLPFLFSFLYLTRELPGGLGFTWLIFLSAWGCDTSAYLVGILIGKHRLAPNLSPKKSIEGAVGGAVGAALMSLVFVYFANGRILHFQNPYLSAALLCFFGGILSQIGDLTASAFKRKSGKKDYGNLIPGHGGVLDRFDSILFTAPLIYTLAILVLPLIQKI